MIKTFSLDRFAETRLLFFGPMAKLPPTLDQHTLRKALKLLNVVNVAPTGLFNKKNKLNFLSFHKNLIGILVKGSCLSLFKRDLELEPWYEHTKWIPSAIELHN